MSNFPHLALVASLLSERSPRIRGIRVYRRPSRRNVAKWCRLKILRTGGLGEKLGGVDIGIEIGG